MNLTVVFKTLSYIALFAVFFTVFGMSSIQKYRQGDIVTVTRTKTNNNGGLPPPAIMVCPEGKFGGAWKEDCNQHLDNITKMDICSRKHSYTQNETILLTYISKINGTQQRYIDQFSWTPTYTNPYVGTCYILSPGKRLLKLNERFIIRFPLNTTVKSHSIYLLDPNFFVIKQDNSFIPFLLLDNPMSKAISCHTIYTSRMNRPDFECNPDESYSYNQCMSQSLARKIGCNNPFDESTQNGNIRNCNTSEEFLEHWNTNNGIFTANQQNLKNITGCKLPCHYSQYSVVGTPRKFEVEGFSYIGLYYSSVDKTTSQEVLLYPLDSLVSEFGGALGLFLGFSFLGLLDIIQTACTDIMKRLKMDQVTFALPDV